MRTGFRFRPGRIEAGLLAVAAGLLAATAPLSAETNAAPPARQTSFADFQLIAERNIFNGNRSGQRVSARPGAPQIPARVESFTLVGTLNADGRKTAFFDGSESAFRRSVRKNEQFAGFTLKEIWPAGVQLEEGTNLIALRVGTALRREDEGHWRYAEPGNYGSSHGGGSDRSAGGGGGAEANEVLRRLIEQRERENQ